MAEVETVFLRRMGQVINRCRSRGLEWDITASDLIDLWESQGGKCAYTQEPMMLSGKKPLSVSVDRIDSSRGYVKGNVHLVCLWANVAKSDLPESEFFRLACKVAGFYAEKPHISALK